MRSLKGQASVEFLVVVAAGLILVGLVAFFLFSQKSTVGSRSEIDSAQLVVNDVARAADDVFVQGPGSVKKIKVTVPESIDFNNSGILDKTVSLSLWGTRVFSSSKVRLTGSFPKQKGFQEVLLNSRADYVFVGQSNIFLSQYSVFANLMQGESITESIVLRNDGSFPLDVNLGKEFESSIVSLDFGSSSFSLSPKQSKTIALEFAARPLGLGQALGKLDIGVSGNDYFENAVIPITVSVKPSKTSSGSLRIIPNSWTVSLKSGEGLSKTFQVCNQSSESSGPVGFSRLEIFSKQLPRTDGGIVWSVFADNDFVYAGMQDGSILVWMKDLTFFKKISETSSPIRAIESNADFVFAGSSDGNVYVLDKKDFSLKAALNANSGPIMGLAVDSDRLYAGSAFGKIIAWSIDGFAQLANFSSSSESINSISLGSDAVFAGSSDGNVYAWKKSDFSFERRLSEPSAPVNSVFSGPDFLFAGTQDGKVFVYDSNSFSLVSVVSKASFSSIKQLYPSPSGNFLAVAAADSGIYFFSKPEFIETFNSSAGKMMQSVYGNGSTVFLGTDDSEVFAINYSEFVSKIASYWVDGLDSLDSIPAQSCADKNFTITVPPAMTSNSFSGDLNVSSSGKGLDVLQIQVNVE